MLFFYPFKSWLIEQAVDDRDYQTIRGTVVPIADLVGGISGTGLLVVSTTQLCGYYNLIGGAISLALMITCTPSHPARVSANETQLVPAIIPSIRLCAQCKEFRQVFVNQVFVDAAILTFSTIVILLLITSFDVKKESDASMLYLIMSIVGGMLGVACNVSCHWILQKVDKLQVYHSLLLLIVLVCITDFVLRIQSLGSLYWELC